eukprot:scaffold5292_cov113-Isochrysis_galbana.AAC.3
MSPPTTVTSGADASAAHLPPAPPHLSTVLRRLGAGGTGAGRKKRSCVRCRTRALVLIGLRGPLCWRRSVSVSRRNTVIWIWVAGRPAGTFRLPSTFGLPRSGASPPLNLLVWRGRRLRTPKVG